MLERVKNEGFTFWGYLDWIVQLGITTCIDRWPLERIFHDKLSLNFLYLLF